MMRVCGDPIANVCEVATIGIVSYQPFVAGALSGFLNGGQNTYQPF